MTEETKTAIARRNPFFPELEPWIGRDLLRSVQDPWFADWTQDRLAIAGIVSPPIDITENDDEYHVRAEMPGVSKEDVTVEFENGLLSIRGEKKSRHDEKTEKGRHLECTYGAFSRSLSLPKDAETDEITASFKDGVLEVAIKKSPDRKPKQIVIKS